MTIWLVKSESSVYSIEDLERDGITAWDGVRNYQARNYLNAMEVADKVLFYHSVDKPIGIAGIAKVIKKAYPDRLQFDKKSDYFDPTALKQNPRWFCPDLGFHQKFETIIELDKLKADSKLKGLVLLQKGSRLSVQPVSDKHYKYILAKYLQSE